MPKLKAGEKEQEFISRCIKQNIKEGLTQEQAAGKCYNMWRQAKKNILIKSLILTIGNFILNKALPPGTKRQRKGGIYQKQPDGSWKKIKEKKEDKKKETTEEELTSQEKIKDIKEDIISAESAINRGERILSKLEENDPQRKSVQMMINTFKLKIKVLNTQMKLLKPEKKPGERDKPTQQELFNI